MRAHTTRAASARPRLLLFLAPASHRHRDPVCATLAWLAAAEGKLFECYYDARPTGSHYGGGPAAGGDPNDMRGGTFTGAHHLEHLLLLIQRFEVEAVSLGPSLLTPTLDDAGVPFRSRSPEVATFYGEIFAGSTQPAPTTLLVVGGGRVPGTDLTPFAFPEISGRKLLAIADGDAEATRRLAQGRGVETLWLCGPPMEGAATLRPGQTASAAAETAWMAERWREGRRGFLLGDAELVGRWTPTAVRRGWVAIHGAPQRDVVERLAEPLSAIDSVTGRQHDDRDFLALSRLGTAFQLVDPGRPPFPVLAEAPASWPRNPPPAEEADDLQLRAWARDGRVLSTLLFWTGMARELESLYALADVLSLTSLAAGLVLTTESYLRMPGPPLSLTQMPAELGGLAPRVELLLASAGCGAMIESEAPSDRFSGVLRRSVDELARRLGGRDRAPRGWWPVMDAPLVPQPPRRVAVGPRSPYVRLRYRPHLAPTGAPPAAGNSRRSLRSLVRESPARGLFEPIRPFTEFQPGQPGRRVLRAVREAGFEYAFTASGFGGPPRAVVDVEGLTALTYTAGRWDGWTPFITVNGLSDLRHAERRLLRHGRPGWLVGTLDTCLWAFTGPVWSRGTALYQLSDWVARGGSTGRLVNVTPRTAARYARLLAEMHLVETLESV